MNKKILKYVLRTGIISLLPILIVLNLKIENLNNEVINHVLILSLYFYLLISLVYYIKYQTEKISELIDNKKGNYNLIFKTLSIVFSISIMFGCYYLCLNELDTNSFKNVVGENMFFQFIDYTFFSFGIFIMNNTSEINANSFYSKLFVATEMLSSFLILVLIFANYNDLKNNKK